MAKLTKTLIDGLKPGATDRFVWDDLLAGFGVRVWPTGRKTYIAQYRAGGRTRRVKIGTHGALTVEEARKEAKGILGDVARGEDPQEDRITRRKSLTVSELCDDYLKAAEQGLVLGKKGRGKKPSTLATDAGRIERHIKPLLGRKLVIDVQQSDISRFLRDVTAGKTAVDVKTGNKRGRAIVEGGAGTASRTTGLLGGIFSYAISQGVIQNNPVQGVKRPADNKRERRLDAEEYRAFGKALADAEMEGELSQAIAGIWLLALTGCRLGEIQKLKWSEVDIESETLRLDDSKSGKSVRPLARRAITVLNGIERLDGNPFVLTGPRSKSTFYGGLDNAMDRITTRAKLEGVTAHTLRHSFASVGGDLNFSESTIGAIVGHSGHTITSRYIHRLDSVLIAAANTIANEVYRQMSKADNLA